MAKTAGIDINRPIVISCRAIAFRARFGQSRPLWQIMAKTFIYVVIAIFMTQTKLVPQDIAIEQLMPDPSQPRSDFGTKGERNRFLRSIKENGILDRLVVSKMAENRYIIIDGHRRYMCAKELGIAILPCDIRPENVDDPEFDRTRFELQNDRRPWKPSERSQAIQDIYRKKNFEDVKELGEYLHLSPSSMSSSLKLQELKGKYRKMTEEYGLSESYLIEFVRLRPKLREIEDYSIDDIVENIFKRVGYSKITSAKEFRKLGSVFSRAGVNGAELHRYLSDPDMTVEELTEHTNRSGFVRDMEVLMRSISDRRSKGIPFTSEDTAAIKSFYDLLKSTFEL